MKKIVNNISVKKKLLVVDYNMVVKYEGKLLIVNYEEKMLIYVVKYVGKSW